LFVFDVHLKPSVFLLVLLSELGFVCASLCLSFLGECCGLLLELFRVCLLRVLLLLDWVLDLLPLLLERLQLVVLFVLEFLDVVLRLPKCPQLLHEFAPRYQDVLAVLDLRGAVQVLRLARDDLHHVDAGVLSGGE
jgi:hypothetical protein